MSTNDHPWTPQQLIEPPLALYLIQEQFPELHAKHIRLFGAGWDNTAFIIDEKIVFRFPRRKIALSLLETEWFALPKIAPRLTVPIPVPEWKGSPTTHFPWPFIGYRILPGVTACQAHLSEETRANLAVPLAKFLAALHAIPINNLSQCHIPCDNKRRIDGAHLTEQIRKNFKDLALLGLMENANSLHSLIERLQQFREPICSCIVHGDFYVRHILVNEQLKLAGVIDWGDIHIGDPAIDLAIAHSFLPHQAHQAFTTAYGLISEETWALAALRALFSSSMCAIFGHHTQDLPMMNEGLRSLHIMANTHNP